MPPGGATDPQAGRVRRASKCCRRPASAWRRTAPSAGPAVRRGSHPFGGATFRFPRATGWAIAMRRILTGEGFGAAEAYRIGLVQEVLPDGPTHGRRAGRVRARGQADATAAARFQPDPARLMTSAGAADGVKSSVERRDVAFTRRRRRPGRGEPDGQDRQVVDPGTRPRPCGGGPPRRGPPTGCRNPPRVPRSIVSPCPCQS
ncbi:enoyl-CoA hydratase-related protein [Streptomyces sp. NPDC059224]|uniref:enoyl-CoA hydratase-related protein n=1 Tax=Streptomyces sp. NPDC059224 TaxID=3346775 RepID=UPI0036C088FD